MVQGRRHPQKCPMIDHGRYGFVMIVALTYRCNKFTKNPELGCLGVGNDYREVD